MNKYKISVVSTVETNRFFLVIASTTSEAINKLKNAITICKTDRVIVESLKSLSNNNNIFSL